MAFELLETSATMRTLLILLIPFATAACLPSRFDNAQGSARERQTVGNANEQADAGQHDGSAGGGKALAGRSGAGGTKAGNSAHADAGASGGTGANGGTAGHAAGASAGAGAGGSSAHAGRGAGDGDGNAGDSANAGSAGGADTTPSAGTGGSNAGAAGAAPSCGDTQTSTQNCGACGNDCSADSARVSCQKGACMRACVASRGDCNNDLDVGAQGDGCETKLADDLANCGECGLHCASSSGGVAACAKSACIAWNAHVGAASPDANALHGAAGGGDPYDQTCAQDEVMVGIDTTSDGNTLFGMAVLCAPVGLSGTPGQLALTLGEIRAQPLLGNRVSTSATIDTVRYVCNPGDAITTVSGGTWTFPGAPTGQQSVKQLSIACAKVSFDAQRHVMVTPDGNGGVGTQDEVVAMFTDSCRAGELVVGFSGRSGSYIDAIQTQCAPLQVSQQSLSSSR
jgi:hypothetical protein